MTVKKIRVETASDNELVRICAQETKCQNPEAPVWETTTIPRIKIVCPNLTLAVIVDMREQVGALSIFDKETGKYINGVGTEEKGYIIIVPWNKCWNYDTVGNIRTGYIAERPDYGLDSA